MALVRTRRIIDDAGASAVIAWQKTGVVAARFSVLPVGTSGSLFCVPQTMSPSSWLSCLSRVEPM